MRPASRRLAVVHPERRAALVVRVSTDMQTRNEEGSLKTQLQRLRQHIDYKVGIGEAWTELEVYELKAVSGKDSMRSPEIRRLLADVESGRVNTVMFTALSRLCRSVRDFLQFVEVLDRNDAHFVSLKEDYDTTSAHGRLIMTIVMALAEFEREQTSERTKDAFAARADRGLWNGNYLFGYDLDPQRKGYLVPNPEEEAIVNFAFEEYLRVGSLKQVRDTLEDHGFRSRAYTSRRGVAHEPKPFALNTVQHMLKNRGYAGDKVTPDGRVVPAVWPAIVERDTFDKVQALMKLNGRANHSQAKPIRHVHILNSGLLRCGKCDTAMVGRSGTGRGGVTYFYYVCLTKGCGTRATSSMVEDAVIERIGVLASSPESLKELVDKANVELRQRRSEPEKRMRAAERALAGLDAEGAMLARSLGAATGDAVALVNAQLGALKGQRALLESAVASAQLELERIDAGAVDPAIVRDGLANFGRVFAHLRPYEQRELTRLVLKRATLHETELVLELYGGSLSTFAGQKESEPGSGFAEGPQWLPEPGEHPNGLEFDVALYVDCGRKRIDGERRYRFPWDEPPEPPCPVSPRKRRRPNPVSIAREWQRSMEERGESKAELARRLGVTRARVTQVLKVLDLDPAVMAFVEGNPDPRITERALRSIVHRPPDEQQNHTDQLLASARRPRRRTSNGRRP